MQETDGSGDSGGKKNDYSVNSERRVRFRSGRMRACGQQRDAAARPLDESVSLFRIPGL